jgi:hypothetical protein
MDWYVDIVFLQHYGVTIRRGREAKVQEDLVEVHHEAILLDALYTWYVATTWIADGIGSERKTTQSIHTECTPPCIDQTIFWELPCT